MQGFITMPNVDALVRSKAGVYRVSKVYRCGDSLFVEVGSGFARIQAKQGDRWPTTHQATVVLELDSNPCIADDGKTPPRFINR